VIAERDNTEALKKLLAERDAAYKADPMAFWHLPKSPLDGGEIKRANPTQLLFHKSLARSRWFIAGNQRGKTVTCAREVAYWLGHNHPFRETPKRPIRVRWYALDYLKVEEILLPRLFDGLAPSLVLTRYGRDGYNAATHILKVKCKYGGLHEIFFSTYDQERHKAEGGEFDLVPYDEPPPQTLYRANQMRLVARGGQEIGALTPLQVEIPWDVAWIHTDIVCKADGKRTAVFTVDGDENLDHLDRAMWHEAMSRLSEEEKEVRIHGRFAFLRGVIYKEFATDMHLCEPFDVLQRVKDGQGLVYVGLDHGDYRNTAATFHYVQGQGDNTRAWVFGEYFDGMGRTIEENTANILAELGEIPIEATYADPATWHEDPVTKTVLAEKYAVAGLPIIPSDNDIPKGHETIRQLLKVPRNERGETWYGNYKVMPPRLMFFRDSAPLTVQALLRYATRSQRTKNDEPGKTVPSARWKHLPDSIRYVHVMHVDGIPHQKPKHPPRVDARTQIPLALYARPRRMPAHPSGQYRRAAHAAV
jgi:phage terminase large subunit-like protein